MYIYNGLCQRNIVAVPPDFCIGLHFGNNTFLTQRPERFQLTGLKIIRFDGYDSCYKNSAILLFIFLPVFVQPLMVSLVTPFRRLSFQRGQTPGPVPE